MIMFGLVRFGFALAHPEHELNIFGFFLSVFNGLVRLGRSIFEFTTTPLVRILVGNQKILSPNPGTHYILALPSRLSTKCIYDCLC